MATSLETRATDLGPTTTRPRPVAPEWRGTDLWAPLGVATSGRIEIVPGASRLAIASDSALPDLCRIRFDGKAPRVQIDVGVVTLRYPRHSILDWLDELLDEEVRAASIVLNGALPWRIAVAGGVSKLAANLGGLRLEAIAVGGGASQVELTLPPPAGAVPVRIGGGASRVTIHRPRGTAARLRVGGGATRLAFDEQRAAAIGGEVRWQSPDAESVANRYEIEVAGGACDLTIDAR